MNQSNEEVPVELLRAWSWRTKRAAFAHYETARMLDRRHYVVGVALVCCSVISTSLAGRSFFGLSSAVIDSFMTPFSAVTLALACLHVFLQDSGRADRYRRSGARYAAIKREIEQMRSAPGHIASSDALRSIRKQMDDLANDALPVPKLVWRNVEAVLGPDKRSFRGEAPG